jgi:hypothetical protein
MAEVFVSAAHMADTAYWFSYLQRPTHAQVTPPPLSSPYLAPT